jgi:isochorismate hydrolase
VPIEKLRFSSAHSLPWAAAAPVATAPHQAVLAGIEAHVCVLQTAFDLLSNGYRVYLAVDACCSRAEGDYNTALQRLANAGVVLTTVESILFEWCETAENPAFKQLSRLVTGRE